MFFRRQGILRQLIIGPWRNEVGQFNDFASDNQCSTRHFARLILTVQIARSASALLNKRREFCFTEKISAKRQMSADEAADLCGRAAPSARRVECMNHLRNLSAAMVGYAEGQKRNPAAGYWAAGYWAGGYWAGAPGNRYSSHNWCVDLLPYVDRRDLADHWDHTVSYSDSNGNGIIGLANDRLDGPLSDRTGRNLADPAVDVTDYFDAATSA